VHGSVVRSTQRNEIRERQTSPSASARRCAALRRSSALVRDHASTSDLIATFEAANGFGLVRDRVRERSPLLDRTTKVSSRKAPRQVDQHRLASVERTRVGVPREHELLGRRDRDRSIGQRG
jgi:hypothetical protein